LQIVYDAIFNKPKEQSSSTGAHSQCDTVTKPATSMNRTRSFIGKFNHNSLFLNERLESGTPSYIPLISKCPPVNEESLKYNKVTINAVRTSQISRMKLIKAA
jgi:hypothetical protein